MGIRIYLVRLGLPLMHTYILVHSDVRQKPFWKPRIEFYLAEYISSGGNNNRETDLLGTPQGTLSSQIFCHLQWRWQKREPSWSTTDIPFYTQGLLEPQNRENIFGNNNSYACAHQSCTLRVTDVTEGLL